MARVPSSLEDLSGLARKLVGYKVVRYTTFVLAVAFLFWLVFLHYTEPHEVGINRNWVTGSLWLDKPGWNINWPWVWTAHMDTRPTRVCVTTAGRGFNCRLVRFKPEHFREFVETEGWYYYWWANRISFNLGHEEQFRGTKDLLKGYGFDIRNYPFIEVLTEYEE